MKRSLTKRSANDLYHVREGVRISGAHNDLSGNVTDLRGDVTGLWGNVSGIRGDVSDLRGDIDNCELTDDERQLGVNVVDLVIDQSAVEAA